MIPARWVSRALWATAAVNVGGGLASLALPWLNARILLGPDVVMDGLLLRYHALVWAFVVAMGVGYGVAARDPEGQRALLWAGALGKLAAVALWLEMLADGLGAPGMWLGVSWDGPLGLLFLAFLVQRRP